MVGGTGLYILTLLQGGATGSPQSTVETKAMVDRLVEEEDGGDWEKRLVLCVCVCVCVQVPTLCRCAYSMIVLILLC